MKPIYDQSVSDTGFYRTSAWKKCRKTVLQRDSGLCQRCLLYGLIVPADVVHHKTHLTPDNINDYTIAYGLDNLISLCNDCHSQVHLRGHGYSRYKVDDNGDIVELLEENVDELIDEENLKRKF